MVIAKLLTGIAVLVSAIFLTYSWSAPSALAFEGLAGAPWLSILMTSGLMFLGLVFGCLFRQLSGRSERVSAWKEVKRVLRSGGFLSAICVSPFVFMSVYAAVKNTPGDPASMLLAFQNGFFCESLFAKMFPERSS
jgi:hypothetical protein